MDQSMEPLLVFTTVGSNHDSRALARTLVERRLAACVNVVEGVRSIYRWKESIEEEHEQLLIIKTSAERVDELQVLLRGLHPYEVPEFVVIAVDQLSEDYRAWFESGLTT